ncbi:hypothetical protein N9L60_03745 [Flavobacteriales bacterium]|nr:hypothetical protein [Flavobacteriales bacterium]
MDFKYSKYIGSILIFLLLSAQLRAQGNNLIYNRVIDTVLICNATTCTDLYINPVVSSPITVPSGFVWKITSVSMERGNVDNNREVSYNNCNSGTGGYLCGNLRKYIGGISFNLFGDNLFSQGEFPMWFNSGTVFDAVMYSPSSTYKWTRSVYMPYRVAIALSIIEFIEVPN